MTLLVIIAVLPWVLSLLLGSGTSRIDRRLNPSTAVVLLPILSAVTAFSVAASAAALAAVLLASGEIVRVSLGVAVSGCILWRSAEVAMFDASRWARPSRRSSVPRRERPGASSWSRPRFPMPSPFRPAAEPS